MNADRTLRFAALGLAAQIGHLVGDYIAQTDHQAKQKAHPDYNITKNTPYWKTWLANQAHCATYHAALCATVAAVAAPLGIKVHPRRAVAAVALSWASHAVIDRRWPVRKLMEGTGSKPYYPVGAPEVDQALHKTFILLAALIASAE